VAEDDRVRRRQGPRDAQVRRDLYVLVPDVAYHLSKWERGYARAINIQGSDHHGTVVRVRAGLQAVSSSWERRIPADYPDYVLHKMVTVMKGGEEMKISKRAGSYVTLRELVDEVGSDATRFFLVSRKADTEFVFDVDLATSQSEENPVYYVQYAHARICSLLEQSRASFAEADPEAHAAGSADLDRSPVPAELALLQRLASILRCLRTLAPNSPPTRSPFTCANWRGSSTVTIMPSASSFRKPRCAWRG